MRLQKLLYLLDKTLPLLRQMQQEQVLELVAEARICGIRLLVLFSLSAQKFVIR